MRLSFKSVGQRPFESLENFSKLHFSKVDFTKVQFTKRMETSLFIGRERELATLRKLYDAETFQFPVIYGRRRVGKTSLISKFSEQLPTVFFTAVEDSSAVNLRNLSRECFMLDHPDADPTLAPVYPDFQTAFEAVFSLAESQRVVFVIDEFPYLAKAEPSVSSILQMLIDRNASTSKLYLILCGSSLSFMREQVLSEKSPLYGRRTAQLEIKPLDFFESREFFPEVSLQDAACYYGMVGGIPLYLKQFDQKLSIKENLESVFFDPSSMLYEEPTNLLKQEVQKAALYNAVIGAIASGKTTANEIATTAGIASAELSYYVKELRRIGLVDQEFPIGSKRRRGTYRLTDNLFSFWYRFVLPSKSLIERGMVERAARRALDHLPEYMGHVFEQICLEWLWRANAIGNLPFAFDEAGRWWGSDPQTKTQEELDIVCLDEGTIVAVAECKWTNKQVDALVLKTLDRRAALAGADSKAYRYVFSKSGFTDDCKRYADQSTNFILIKFESILD